MRLTKHILLLFFLFVWSSPAASQQADLEAKRQWVEEVEAGDYFFWRRYLDRLDRQGAQFPQPERWYRPSELVEGGESGRFPRKGSDDRTISQTAWKRAKDYAFARETGALIVARGGRVEFEAYREGLGPASLLSTRSFAKTITGLLYGIAIEKGVVGGLDDAVGKYIAEWADDPRGNITLRQLLSYSSGLEVVEMAEFSPTSKAARLAEGSNVNAVALSYRLAYEPGSALRLTNAEMQIAGLVLERVTGQRYAKLLSSWLWSPLEAGTATLNLDGMDGNARIFCCMRGRAIDWMRLGQMLLDNDGAIVPPEFLAEMLSPGRVNTLMGLTILLGWEDGLHPKFGDDGFLIVPQAEPFETKGLFYLLGGRSITLWIAPEHDLVVFRWGNDVKDWDNGVIVNHLVRDLAP